MEMYLRVRASETSTLMKGCFSRFACMLAVWGDNVVCAVFVCLFGKEVLLKISERHSA